MVEAFGVYRDIGIVIWQKHAGTWTNRSWGKFYGDIPVAMADAVRGFTPVANPRGRAYALRNARKFRPTRRELRARLCD